MILLPIIFLLIFGRFGLEDADSGFIVGMGWRIFNGEIPYRDFYYVRPIISPLISYIFLNIFPDYAQILLMRLVNYYQLMIQDNKLYKFDSKKDKFRVKCKKGLSGNNPQRKKRLVRFF